MASFEASLAAEVQRLDPITICHVLPTCHRYDRTFNISLERVVIHADQIMPGCIDWRLDDGDEGGAGSLALSSIVTPISYQWPMDDFKKIRHELVIQALTTAKSDERLDIAFGSAVGDACDRLTPDMVFCIDKKLVFIELATCRSDDRGTIRNIIDEKLFKYQEALMHRSQMFNVASYLGIVVVTPNSVRSPVELDETIVQDLLTRFHLGRMIEDKYPQWTTTLSDTDELQGYTAKTNRIKEMLERVAVLPTPPKVHDLWMDDAFHERCMEAPDLQYARDYMLSSLAEAAKEMAVKHEVVDEASVPVCNSTDLGDVRMDIKPVVLLPLVHVTEEQSAMGDTSINHIYCEVADHYMAKLWTLCIEQSQLSGGFDYEESVDVKVVKALEMQDTLNKEARRVYRRVQIADIPRDVQVLMAARGVGAKSFDQDPYVSMEAHRRSLPFSWHVDTTDISKFISMVDGPAFDILQLMPRHTDLLDLIESADQLHLNKESSLFNNILSSRYFKMLDFISCICQELVVSLRQNVRKREFIMKKLRHHQAYLLIKPTKLSSHIFVSILVKKRDLMYLPKTTCFGELIDCGNVYVSKFVSFLASKLQNQVQLPLHWAGSLIRWHMELGGDPNCELLEDILPAAKKMANLTVLIAGEDKAHTEEAVTNFRYMLMECLRDGRCMINPNPHKMIAKMNTLPRGRLEIFIQHMNIRWSNYMLTFPPRNLCTGKIEDSSYDELSEGVDQAKDNENATDCLGDQLLEQDVSRDRWQGLYNPYTLDPVVTAASLIQVMYVGYYKNKDELASANTDFHLLKKILQNEFSYDPKRVDYYGRVDPPIDDIRPHEFSPSMVKLGCDIMESRMKSWYGSDHKEQMANQILRELSMVSLDELSTMKASAQLDPTQDVIVDCSTEQLEKEARIKVIEAVDSSLELIGINPMENVDKLVNELDTRWSSGVVCDIFKKNQHGGIREIYVMIIVSRVVQKCIETVSRTMLKTFPEDTLANPHMKLVNIDNHNSKCNKKKKDITINSVYNINNSDDESQWNNNIMVTSFGLIFSRLLPRWLSKPLQRMLNLWLQKRIRIPNTVLKLLMKGVKLRDGTYQTLLNQWWDDEDSDSKVVVHMGKYLKLVTGMWQGILHFTSSLLHVCQILHFKAFSDHMLGSFHHGFQWQVSVFCSSDDSGLMISVWRGPETSSESDNLIIYTANLFCMLKKYQSRAFNMISSPKSTIGLPGIVEYNSVFIIYGTVVTPTIKFWVPAMSVKSTENLKARQEQSYNMLTELAENRAGAMECRLLDLMKSVMHYKCLGMDLNPLFHEYKESVIGTHNPELGFYLTDEELLPGVLGFNYSCWNAARKGNYGASLKKLLTSGHIQVDEKGSMFAGCLLKFGDRKRWKAMIDKMSKGVDLDDELIKSPISAFRYPRSVSEAHLQLLIKANSPGTHQSLSRGNNTVNSISSSVYAISAPCMTESRIELSTDGKIETSVQKKSLLSLVFESRKPPHDTAAVERLKEAEIPLLFPGYRTYEGFKDVLSHFKLSDSTLLHGRQPRIRQKKITMSLADTSIPLTLNKCAKSMWFSLPIKASSSVISRCWEAHKKMYPWLSDSFPETLNKSPFLSVTSLIRFIKTEKKTRRSVTMLVRPMKSQGLYETISELVSCNQHPDYLLSTKEPAQTSLGKEGVLSECMSRMALSACMALPGRITLKEVRQELDSIPIDQRDIVTSALGANQKIVMVMALTKQYENDQNKDRRQGLHSQIIKLIRGIRGGVVAYFKTSQRYNAAKDEYEGEGTARIEVGKLLCDLHIKDKVVKRLIVNSTYDLRVNAEMVAHTVHEWRLSFETEPVFGGMFKFTDNGTVEGARSTGSVGWVDRDLKSVLVGEHAIPLQLIIRSSRLCVATKGSRPSTLLSLPLRPWMILSSKKASQWPRLIDAWKNYGQWSAPEAHKYIYTLYHLINSFEGCDPNSQEAYNKLSVKRKRLIRSCEKDAGRLMLLTLSPTELLDLFRWLRHTFKARLQITTGGRTFFPVSDILQPETDVFEPPDREAVLDHLRLCLEGIKTGQSTGMFEDLGGSSAGAFWSDDIEEDEEFSEEDEVSEHLKKLQAMTLSGEDIQEWAKMTEAGLFSEIGSHREENILYLHPLWDNFISRTPELCQRVDYWAVVQSGRKPNVSEESDKVMAWFLGVEFKEDSDTEIVELYSSVMLSDE